MDHDSTEDPARLRVRVQGDAIVIAVSGTLDGKSVGVLGSAATCALNCQCKHVRVDLREVTGFTEGGVAALAVMQSLLPPDRARRVLPRRLLAGPGRPAGRLRPHRLR